MEETVVRTEYPTDLTEQQLDIMRTCIPPAKPGGPLREVDIREILNALCYMERTGCALRM